MGGRHSKRSMDVTTTPKKDGIPAEGDAPAVGDGKLERIEEADANTTKPTTNGVAPHTDTPEDKDNVNEKESATEKDKEKDDDENKAADESKPESPAAESPAEAEQVTTPTEGTPASPKEVTSPDTKEAKKKDKTKKKWSFRSISFSKKDKSKPVREDTPKNGDVSKEEPLTEGGEEGENTTEAASPAEDKSATSPTDSLPESKDEEKVSPSAVTASPADENKEAPSSPAPTPVPEAKKEDNEVPVEKVEVSPAQAAPVEVKSQSPPQKISPPSIIERKTTEDFPSLLPSSPPPTPIDPSPLQQAQQAAPNATTLAEALKPALNSNNQHPLITNESNNKSNESNESSNVTDNPIESDVKPEVIAPVIESIEIQELDQDVEKIIPEVIDIVPQVVDDVSENVDDVSEVADDLSEVAEVLPIIDSVSETIEPTAEIIDTVTEIIELETESKLPDAPILPSVPKQTEDIIIESEEGPIAVSADDLQADVPPPLPESPIPVPKASADLMNFMASQISDDYNLTSELSLPPADDSFDTKVSESPEQLPAPQDDDLPPPPPQPELEVEKEEEILEVQNNELCAYEKLHGNKSPSPKSPTEDLLTPPASPNPSVKSSQQDKLDKQEQQDKMNGYVYDKCETVINDRLAETVDINDDNDNKQEEVTTKDSLFQNHQSIPEVEAPVENNVAEKTETVEEENKSPVPPVVSEPPASLGPAITEDVTSVTKAVEEIDINEKAVAAAVNENIEAVNKNEIIAEMNHQNNLNE